MSHLHFNASANDFIHGDETGYQGDITTCSDCWTEYSEFEAEHFVELKGLPVCSACAETCECCGNWFDDDSIADCGPMIVYRDSATGGKSLAHATCLTAALFDKEEDEDAI